MRQDNGIYRRVIAYLSGKLSDDESKKFERLIRRDAALCKLVDSVRRSRSAATSSSPRWSSLMSSAHLLLERQLKEARKRTKKRSYAITTFDSSLSPSPVSARDVAIDSRRLKMRSESISLELKMDPIGYQSCDIVGLISGLDDPGELKVRLIANGQKVDEATAVAGWPFSFERIEKGSYILKVFFGRKVLLTADLDV